MPAGGIPKRRWLNVCAVHMVALAGPDSAAKQNTLQGQWARCVAHPARRAGLTPPRLLLLQAQYRRLHEPLLKLVRQIEAAHPQRTVAILIPELVKQSWWQYLLHTHRARRLRSVLLQYSPTASITAATSTASPSAVAWRKLSCGSGTGTPPSVTVTGSGSQRV